MRNKVKIKLRKSQQKIGKAFQKVDAEFVSTAIRRLQKAEGIFLNTTSLYPPRNGTALTTFSGSLYRALQFYGETALKTLPPAFFREKWQLGPTDSIELHFFMLIQCYHAGGISLVREYENGHTQWTETQRGISFNFMRILGP